MTTSPAVANLEPGPGVTLYATPARLLPFDGHHQLAGNGHHKGA